MSCSSKSLLPTSHDSARHSPHHSSLDRIRHTDQARLRALAANLRLRLSYAKLKVNHGWQNQTLNQVEHLYFLRRPRKQSLARGLCSRHSKRLASELTSDTDESKDSADSDVLSRSGLSATSTKLTTPDVESFSDDHCPHHWLIHQQIPDFTLPDTPHHGPFSIDDSPLCDRPVSSMGSVNPSPLKSSSLSSLGLSSSYSAQLNHPLFQSSTSVLPGSISAGQPTWARSTIAPAVSNCGEDHTPLASCSSSPLEHFNPLQFPAPLSDDFSSAAIWPTSASHRTFDEFWKACSAAADTQLHETDYTYGLEAPTDILPSDPGPAEPHPSVLSTIDMSLLSPVQCRSIYSSHSKGTDSLTSFVHQPITPLQLHHHQRPADFSRNSPSTIGKAHRNRLYSAPSGLDEGIDISLDDLDGMNWS